MTTRREVLAGALGLAAGLSGLTASGAVVRDHADESHLHPALRRLRGEGVIVLLAAEGKPAGVRAAMAELARRAGSDVTLGLGPSFFDVADLAARRPPGFVPMPGFPGDVLLPERTNADVCVQVEGDSAAAVARRADELLYGVSELRVTWRTAVRRTLARTQDGRALQRNPFGFVEGQGNPHRSAAPGYVLTGTGASYLALRVIRLATEQWNADDPRKHARIIGRHADGRWLDGTSATAEPAFVADPEGARVPLDSHARKVNPRTPGAPAPRMVRRSWDYHGGMAAGGVPDEGVVFMAFQNDLAAGFELAQARLRGDALSPYLLAVGGGYFLVPGPSRLTA